MRQRNATGIADERGQAVVLFALALVAIVGMAGLVIDGSNLQENRRKLQNAADAAALAGSYDLPSNYSQATTDALTWLGKNGSGAAEVVTNSVNGAHTQITISLTRKVTYSLAGVLGVYNSNVTATAQVQVASVTGYSSSAANFFPYAVWAWNASGQVHQIGDQVIFRSNAWVSDNVQNPGSNPNWPANANNFKGYMTTSGGTIHVGDVASGGGNKCGQEPVAGLQAAYNAGEPVVLPIIDNESGNGNYTLTIVGFVALDLNIAADQLPSGCPNDFVGKIVGMATGQGSPLRTGTTPPSFAQCGTGFGICTPVLSQ